MHFTIHSDAAPSPTEAKRSALAILALAGLTAADLRAEEIRSTTTDARVAIDPVIADRLRAEFLPADGFTAEEIKDQADLDPAQVFAKGSTIPLVPADAQASTSVPAAPPAISVDLDSAGLPWDDRIHGGFRTKNKDGTWRTKRGVLPEVLAAVTAALQAGAPAPPAPPPPPPGALGNLVLTFAELVAKIQGALGDGTLTQTRLVEHIQSLGYKTLQEVASQPKAITDLAELIS